MSAPATVQPLKLEVGKSYRTRKGSKVRIVRRDADDTEGMPFECDSGYHFTPDGRAFPSLGDSSIDLIAEWDAPDADGWIQWSGGECPVPPETVVQVRCTFYHHNKHWVAKDVNWQAVRSYRIVKPAPKTPKQEPQTMPRDINQDCLLEAIENSIAAKQIGDAEGAARAAAEFRKYLRQAIRECAAEQQELAKELAKVLGDIVSQSDRIDRDSMGRPHRTPECQELYDRALAIHAKAKAAGLV